MQDYRDFLLLKKYRLTVTGASWTTAFGWAYPFQNINGDWEMDVNIQGTSSNGSTNSITLTIAGISVDSLVSSALTVFDAAVSTRSSDQYAYVYAIGGTATVQISMSTAIDATNMWSITGRIPLASKPDWMD